MNWTFVRFFSSKMTYLLPHRSFMIHPSAKSRTSLPVKLCLQGAVLNQMFCLFRLFIFLLWAWINESLITRSYLNRLRLFALREAKEESDISNRTETTLTEARFPSQFQSQCILTAPVLVLAPAVGGDGAF